MAVEYSDDGWFGTAIRITGESKAKLNLSRNHPATGQHPRDYYISVAGGGDRKDIVITEEDMLALFQHFLKCHDEYESGESNE